MASSRTRPPSTRDTAPPTVFEEIVQVVVGAGDGLVTFEVPKNLLRFYSGYFQALFAGSWRETQSGVVDLPLQDPDTFYLFKQWMCQEPFGTIDFTSLGELCIFADEFDVPLFHNEVLDEIHRKIMSEWCIPVYLVKDFYENTPEEHPLRRYIIEVYAKSQGYGRLTSRLAKCFPFESLVDLLNRVWGPESIFENKRQFARWDLCRFHQHEEGVQCKKPEHQEEPRDSGTGQTGHVDGEQAADSGERQRYAWGRN